MWYGKLGGLDFVEITYVVGCGLRFSRLKGTPTFLPTYKQQNQTSPFDNYAAPPRSAASSVSPLISVKLDSAI